MGSYVDRFWVSDATGMNKAERMGGPYRPYIPDMLRGFELLMEPSCAAAVTRSSEALAELERAGSLTDVARVRHRPRVFNLPCCCLACSGSRAIPK